jgi:HEAT repeat protein
MTEERHCDIAALLESHDPGELRRGLEMVRATVPGSDAAGTIRLCEMVLPLFYIDTLDHPEHLPVVEEAILVTSEMGEAVIPTLIQNLEAGDVKAQMALAQALGGMGAKAIGPLLTEYAETCPDPACHAFLLYALGKVKSPEIAQAAPLAAEAARSPDLELRDTATRAIGKFAESIPASGLSEDVRAAFVSALQANLADASPGVRSKAVRSLGKLAKYGHLTAEEHTWLYRTVKRLLGEDEHFEWDRAYIVRKEAKEALGYVRRVIEEDLL